MTTDGRPPAERLLAAAEELFGERSYGRTGVADICARAGMATGSFYAYYGSKAEIFAAVVRAINADLRTAMKAAVDKADGSTAESAMISKMDLHQLFQFNRFLGDQYNDSLSLKDKIAPHERIDRMVAARFDLPVKTLESAKMIHLNIQDVDGPLFETSKSLK